MAKTVHLAAAINLTGNTSAACFHEPRPINLKVATWTNRPEAVTCIKCKQTDRYRSRTAPACAICGHAEPDGQHQDGDSICMACADEGEGLFGAHNFEPVEGEA